MAGTKRASTAGDKSPKSKKAKVDEQATSSSKKKGNSAASSAESKKAAKKSGPTPAAFKASALPLHFHVSHTPPAGTGTSEQATDVGAIGHITALPTTFSTGSLGWKGSKRLTICLEGGDGEKVQVQLNINATVIGTKPAAKEGEVEAENDEADDGDE